ncbi:ECF transporter S component [Candidatus Epulonipiscium viviparus]|uniref:ECF transporter S component n=1 Tax=Candidatus Epulonipiscium viviparus TaxID=420336 RepID=UPI0027380A4A|nr:ECF transporter S component [Candidatus Epulopiscium viviparus]
MKTNTKALTLLGVLLAVEILLSYTPLGFIPLPFMNATTTHIPVIIGGVFLGPVGGGILGLAFGLLSILRATMAPTLTSFVFSPFVSIGGVDGNFWSVVIAIVPRILIGVLSYYAYALCKKYKVKDMLAYAVTGIVGSLTNTIFVMGLIYVCFGEPYAAAVGVEAAALFGFIMGIVGMNGVPEAIIAAIIVSMLCKILKPLFKGDLRLRFR